MSNYPYTPLQFTENSIRLLRIQGGEWYNDIQCQLVETALGPEEGCPYIALSYTWGHHDHTPREPRLLVNESEVSVSKSLHAALRHIRRRDQDLYLWVDALCINQSDDEERSSQVSQMGNIYAAAEEVIVWLGEAVEGIEVLFKLVTRIDGQAARLHQGWNMDSWYVLCSRQTPSLFQNSEHKNVLKEVLERPWFQRVWIIQEVALAKMVTVRCGHYTCPARTFARIPSLIGLEVNEQTQAVLDIMPHRRTSTWWSSTRYLHFLLEKFRDSKSSRPRDKIYALLGISEDAHDPNRFYPYYTNSDRKVFRDTGSFLVFGEVLGSNYSLPEFTLPQLSQPIIQLAEHIMNWALGYKGDQREATRRTAMSLVGRLNEGDLKTPDLLLSLAETRGRVRELHDLLTHGGGQVRELHDLFAHGGGQVRELHNLFAHGDVQVGVEFDDEKDTLTVFSHAPETPTVRLDFASRPESLESESLPLLYNEVADVTVQIRELKLADVPKDALLRAYAWKGDKYGVQEQLDDGVDVNAADWGGRAALHFASYRGNVEIVQLLLRSGADEYQEDVNGKTPLFYVARGTVSSH